MKINENKLSDIIHKISQISNEVYVLGYDSVAQKLLDIRQELLESIIDE